MTAILISRIIDDSTDYLYIFADQRITSDDRIMSNHNQKIFSFPPNNVRSYRRHYVTVGDVAPTDYILHRLEAINDMESLYQFIMESELFTKMPHDAAIYMINESPGVPEIIVIEKSKDYTGTRTIDMEELKQRPLFDGSGGLYVQVALDAVMSAVVPGKYSYTDLVEIAFASAADSITSMNARVSIVQIPIPVRKIRKSRRALKE